MDDERFDALIRVLGTGAPRRRVIATALATLPLAFGGNAAAKKKKCKKGKKKCGKRCIPKSHCCTDAQCDESRNERCTNGACACVPNCEGRGCLSDGCGRPCNTCRQFFRCTPEGQCVCEPDCFQKGCASDGCGNPCKTCDEGETCNDRGQCCNANGECDCNQGYECGESIPICDAQSNCVCTSALEGGTVCAADLCDLSETCQSTEFCVDKWGPGSVCQAPGTGCCGQRCVVPCGFVPEGSVRERGGLTGEGQTRMGRNVGSAGLAKDR